MKATEVVAAYFAALANGELEKALSSFTPGTKWCQPGNNQFAGMKNNLDEIIEMFQGIMEHTSGNMQVKPNGTMLQSGDLVAVPVWFNAKTSTKSMDLGGLDLFEMRGGQIVNVWTFSDNQLLDDEFFG